MKVNKIDLSLNKNVLFSTILEYKEDNKNVFTDFTGYTFKAQFRVGKTSTTQLITTVTPTVVGLGQIKLSLTDAQTKLFPGTTAYYDLLAQASGGEPGLMFQGSVTITDVITQWENTAPVTTASVLAGTFNTDQTVSLTVNEVGATVYYTTNGSTPTASSSAYTTPLAITATTTLKFYAVDTAGNAEAIQTIVYTIDKVAPVTTCNIAADATIATTDDITLTADETATTYYTTNGTTPTTSSTQYAAAFQLAAGAYTIKFFSVDTAGNIEAVKTVANITVA